MVGMDFSVNPRALHGLSDALDLRAHDLTGAAHYLRTHSALAFGAGLGNELFQTHQQIMAEVESFLFRAGSDYAERYALGIGRAAYVYASTDQAASARLDASLPGIIDPSDRPHLAEQSVGPEIFTDPHHLHLADPPDFRSQYPYHPHWYDLLSPSSIPRDVIWYVTGALAKLGLLSEQIDPFETFTAPLCGDWAGLERVSFALTEVARALSFVSIHVTDEAGVLDRIWTGHAASNCRSALRRFAADLRPAADLVIEIAADYHKVAEAARQQGEALATLVTMMIDITGSCGTEVGVELAETLVDASRLAEIARALGRVIHEAKTAVELLHLVIEGANGHLSDLRAELGLLTVRPFTVNLPDDMPALPAAARR
jgi:hypothetical protein